MPAPRRGRAGRLPLIAALPTVVLATTVPGSAAVVAVPTVPGDPTVPADGAARLVGQTSVDVDGLLEREQATGAAGEVVTAPGAGPDQRVLLVGLGGARPDDWRKVGATLARRAKDAVSLAVDLREAPLDAAALRGLVEGLLLASYRYSRKAAPKPRVLTEITLVTTAELSDELTAAVALSTAVASARDLVNTPPGEKSPAWLATRAASLLHGLDVTVLDETELAERGFGGIVAVGQGSSRPPRLVEAVYDGGGSRHVVLVGKGITFDTGGLSLKPNAGMQEMKSDMGGAAAVLATLRAVADLKLPIKVTVLAAVAENMPSGQAQRPGDVLVQYGGRTVEVLNTDAEGRLVLADAIAYADLDLQADVIVDVATLTGAMPVALGKRHAGLFASDDSLAEELLAASTASGEPLWRMPLVEDYRAALDSPIADLRNIGRPALKLQGGSITAALFLREFAGGRPWAHLDIAGPAFTGGDDDERTKGGTGYGVRLLTTWLTALAAQPRARSARRRSA